MVTAAGVQAAKADEDAAEYGVDGITVTPEERQADQQYGGFPNSKDFNNDTRCPAVVRLFATPGMGPNTPKMKEFLTYARIKLMELDTIWHAFHHVPRVIDAMDPEQWKALPALFPSYCRTHPNETLEHVAGAAYMAARITTYPDEANPDDSGE